MYKFYVVPDATILQSHQDIYNNMQLFWDPYAESDAYAISDPKWKGELNKADSLEFMLLPGNIHYNDFHKKKSVVIVYDDDTWLFEGVVADSPIDFFKQRKVSCIGALSYLCDSIQVPDEKNQIEVPVSPSGTRYLPVADVWLSGADPRAQNWYEQRISTNEYGQVVNYVRTSDRSVVSGKQYYYTHTGDGKNYSGKTVVNAVATEETIVEHLSRIIAVHNSQVDAFKQFHLGTLYSTTDSEKQEFKSSNFRTSWDSIKSDILDEFGRYLTVTRGEDNQLYLNYIAMNQLPSSSIPLIEFANNMLEMSEADERDSEVFTILVPIGKDNLTVSAVTGHDTPNSSTPNSEINPYIATFGGEKRYVVVSEAALNRYGHIVKTQSFSDVSKPNDLYDRAVKYIQNNYDYHREYDVKAIDLRFITGTGHRICIGDKCRLHSVWHGVDINELYVISAEHDLMNPENDTYKIGIPSADREASNKTLTGQSNRAKSKQNSDSSGASAGMSRMKSILEEYIKPGIEWGLEIHSSLFNQVTSDDQLNYTRFEQTSHHISLMAQKVFGIDTDQQDVGFVLVPVSQRQGKIPSVEHWYEYKNGQYILSKDPSPIDGKDYFISNLETRVSEIEVGEGGIHGMVLGNYARSTASSSWIDANEERLLALTGHIFLDENGQIIIDAAAGARTGYKTTANDPNSPKYIAVRKSEYAGKQPVSLGWYERRLQPSGEWPGENQPDAMTEDRYYIRSNDTTAKPEKQYYVRSTVVETYHAEYGIFDEGNLTGGVLAKAVNYPEFRIIEKYKYPSTTNPSTETNPTWYVYNDRTGLFAHTLDTSINPNTLYYERVDNMRTYTNIMGDHIVIGGRVDENGDPIIFDGVDDATRARINNYTYGKTLDGTIVELATDMLYTRALITNYIGVISTKIFGSGTNDDDYVVVKNAGAISSKNPSAEGWYEKNSETNEYFVTADAVADRNKAYYVTRLTSRVTDFEVGEGGIHATVKGNYDRSIASMAWIEANEEKLNLLLGHIGEDANGNLVIDAGAGLRTGYKRASSLSPRYFLVPRTDYPGSNPSTHIPVWYERKYESDGSWSGDGKTDSDTNDAYYKITTDTTPNYTKQYFVKSNTAEQFVSEYGVYNQGNLTAGVIAQTVNHPEYISILPNLQPSNANPSTATTVVTDSGTTVNSLWYVYDMSTGGYGRAVDRSIAPGTVYYYRVAKSTSYTDIHGEHIVIGRTEDYNELDANTKAKVNRYITDNNLNGTVTEIASDVVTVNTLIAKYIDVEEITVGTSLSSDVGYFNHLRIYGTANAGSGWASGLVADEADVEDLRSSHLTIESLRFSAVGTGSGLGYDVEPSGLARMGNPNDIVMGFGSPTTSGDTVTIPFTTLYDYCQNQTDNTHVISFDKPASLGTVTWSDGERLTVKTAGDKTFFSADLQIQKNYSGLEVSYQRRGSDFADLNYSLLNNKPTLKATLQVTGTWSGLAIDPSEDDPHISTWEKSIFFDASQAYDDGIDEAKSKFGLYGPGSASNLTPIEQASIFIQNPLAYDTVYEVYKTYDGAKYGDRVVFKTPVDRHQGGIDEGIETAKLKFGLYGPGAASGLTPAEESYISSQNALAYDTVYEVYKTYDGSKYGDRSLFKTPVDRYGTGYNTALGTLRTYSTWAIGDGGDVSLGYGGSIQVFAQYRGNGASEYSSLGGLIVRSPSAGSFRTYASYNNTDYTSGTIALGNSDSVTVYGQRIMDGENSWSSASGITITSPAESTTTITKDDISTGSVSLYTTSQNQPSHGADFTFNNNNPLSIASRVAYYIYFKVTVKGTEKWYRIHVSGA